MAMRLKHFRVRIFLLFPSNTTARDSIIYILSFKLIHMCYIFVSLYDNCAIADSIYKSCRFLLSTFRCEKEKKFQFKEARQTTQRELVETVFYWRVRNIDDDLMCEKLNDSQRKTLCVCLKAATTGGERLRSQQKIALFECIQLFCLWALFEYDIIVIIVYPSGRFLGCQALGNVYCPIPRRAVTSLTKKRIFCVLRIVSSARSSTMCWKHNKKYFAKSFLMFCQCWN